MIMMMMIGVVVVIRSLKELFKLMRKTKAKS